MTMIEAMLLRLYAALLRCYPREIRDRFGAEMRDVFRQALSDARQRGSLPLLRRAVREYGEGSLWVLVEHWFAIRPRLIRSAFDARRTSGPANPIFGERSDNLKKSADAFMGDSREALWAAAPLFLFGLGISLNSLVRGGPWYTIPLWRLLLSIGIGLGPMLFIGFVALLAIIRRVPDESWLWVGAGYTGFLLLVKTFSEERADVGQAMLTPTMDVVVVLLILLFGAGLVLWAASRGFRQAGMLGIGLSGTLALSFFLAVTVAPFYRHDLAVAAAPVGAIFSGLAYAFQRGSTAQRAGVLAATLAINFCAIAMAQYAWSDWLAEQGRGAPLLPLLVLSGALLLSSPLLQLLKRPFENLRRSF
jgi:hypothetical protein